MAEYVMGPDDTQEEVSRSLIEHAGPDRAHEIAWYPRPGVPGGGVFWMPDDLVDSYSGPASRIAHGDAEQPPTSARTRRAAAKAAETPKE